MDRYENTDPRQVMRVCVDTAHIVAHDDPPECGQWLTIDESQSWMAVSDCQKLGDHLRDIQHAGIVRRAVKCACSSDAACCSGVKGTGTAKMRVTWSGG